MGIHIKKAYCLKNKTMIWLMTAREECRAGRWPEGIEKPKRLDTMPRFDFRSKTSTRLTKVGREFENLKEQIDNEIKERVGSAFLSYFYSWR